MAIDLMKCEDSKGRLIIRGASPLKLVHIPTGKQYCSWSAFVPYYSGHQDRTLLIKSEFTDDEISSLAEETYGGIYEHTMISPDGEKIGVIGFVCLWASSDSPSEWIEVCDIGKQ